MRKVLNNLIIGLGISLIIGCASGYVLRYPSSQVYPPTNYKTIQVYYSTPPMLYEKIGEVSARGDLFVTGQSVYNKLRKKASEIGGHGIIVIQQSKDAIRDQGLSPVWFILELKGVVIRYK